MHTSPAPWLSAWLAAFLITQLVEVPVYLHPSGGGLWRRGEGLKSLSRALTPTCATHPLIWWPLHDLARLSRWTYLEYFCVAEGLTVAMEAWLAWALGARRPLRAALLANALSVSVGWALRTLGAL